MRIGTSDRRCEPVERIHIGASAKVRLVEAGIDVGGHGRAHALHEMDWGPRHLENRMTAFRISNYDDIS